MYIKGISYVNKGIKELYDRKLKEKGAQNQFTVLERYEEQIEFQYPHKWK